MVIVDTDIAAFSGEIKLNDESMTCSKARQNRQLLKRGSSNKQNTSSYNIELKISK